MADVVIVRVVTIPLVLVASVVALKVASAAAEGRIAKNNVVGLRTPYTLSSEEAWRDVHRRTLPILRWVPAAVLALSTLSLVPIRGHWAVADWFLVAAAAALPVGVVGAGTYAVARSKQEPPAVPDL